MNKRLGSVVAMLAFGFIAISFVLSHDWIGMSPKSGDSIPVFLKRYLLQDSCSKAKFLELNSLKSTDMLLMDKKYKLPVYSVKYDGKSIRSTLGITDYNKAKSIQDYNLSIYKKGSRRTDYRVSKILWVPHHLMECKSLAKPIVSSTKRTINIPLFGKEHSDVTIKTNKLKGMVYYLVSGHGGPDPGAMSTVDGHSLCEDEYAYDVTIRLAKELMEQGAKVYMITKDLNDGIRDERYLKCDKDERCHPNQIMPLNQVKRLRQRATAVNALYKKHKKEAKRQRCVVIHVDSRSRKEQIDVFFYHYKHSKTGKKLANKMQSTFKAKYEKYQKGRGYGGAVSHRNLYMLTTTLPVTTYIELGNIQHPRDRKRIIEKDNRQALAKWIGEALINE